MSSATRAASPKLCVTNARRAARPFATAKSKARASAYPSASARRFRNAGDAAKSDASFSFETPFPFCFGEDPPSFVVETWSTFLDGLMLRGFCFPTPRTVFFPNALEKTSSATSSARISAAMVSSHRRFRIASARSSSCTARPSSFSSSAVSAPRASDANGSFVFALGVFEPLWFLLERSDRSRRRPRAPLEVVATTSAALDDVDAPSSWESSDAPRRSAAFARVDAAFIAGSRHSEEALAGLPRAARTPPPPFARTLFDLERAGASPAGASPDGTSSEEARAASGRRGQSRALRGGTTQGATPRRATRADWLEDPSGRERGTQRASKPEAGDARMATGDEAAKSDPAACVPIYGRSQTNKMTRPFTVCFERVGECRWLNARSAATRDARRLDGPELSPQHERPSKCRARDTSPGERRESATPWKSFAALGMDKAGESERSRISDRSNETG